MNVTPVLFALGLAAPGALAQVPVKPAEPAASTRALTLAPSNARWVARMYQDLLGRAPDASAANAFLTALDHGATRAQIATQVVSSAEYRSLVVRDLYGLYLHRAADPASVSFWVGRLGSVGYLGMQKGILSSAEYLAARGGGTIDGFVDALYQDVLGRPADKTVHANLLTQFAGAGLSQKGLVESLCGSGEGRAALVNQLFKRLLRRAPDPGAGAFFASQLGSGTPEETVLVEIVSSPEYYQKS
jgi:hypothetical protein